MKKIILLFKLFIACKAQAQLQYPNQPKPGYYEDLKKRVIPFIPTQAELLAAKSETIPVIFKDTLLKYDWYEIASYYIYDKEYSSYFLDSLEVREQRYANNQFNFIRYNADGNQYSSSISRLKDGKVIASHTMFDLNTAMKLLEVKKIGAKTMKVMQVFTEKEMTEIFSYKNGVMILNIKQSPNATTKRFITAYMAIPKAF